MAGVELEATGKDARERAERLAVVASERSPPRVVLARGPLVEAEVAYTGEVCGEWLRRNLARFAEVRLPESDPSAGAPLVAVAAHSVLFGNELNAGLVLPLSGDAFLGPQ